MTKEHKELAHKPDDDTKAAVADLHERVGNLEAELKRLQNGLGHIINIQPIPK